MFKKLLVRFLESKLAKGKLTYGALAVSLLPVLDHLTGANITTDEWGAAIAGVGAIGVVLGKLRAVYQAK